MTSRNSHGDAPDEPESAAEPRPRTRARRATRSTRSAVDALGLLPGSEAAAEAPAPPKAARRQSDDLPTVSLSEPSPPAAPAASGPRFDVTLDPQKIDPDVEKVIRRLVRHGHEAYLVGGCVRDLLLGRRPKDFDVATSARPEEVRSLFRNSRVIGRRFRLVHVLFAAGKVIEVATFRRNPNAEIDESDSPDVHGADAAQLLIRSDNVFGVASEDAARRDFTINALFYDLEAGQILDWCGGLADIQGRVVNTIGEPHTRFREDPVRILRALKFAGRLDLGIAPDCYDAIVTCRDALELAARPRLAEEVLRLLRGGQARRTVYLAWDTGVLDVVLPELSSLLYDSFGASTSKGRTPGDRVFRLLEWLDRGVAERGALDDVVLWTLLLLEPLKEATDGARDRNAASAELLDPLLERLAIPRRIADAMRRIVAVLPRITSGKVGRFARTELFDAAVDVAEADLYARGLPLDPVLELRRVAGEVPLAPRPARAPFSGRARPTPRH